MKPSPDPCPAVSVEREQLQNGHWRALDRALQLAVLEGDRVRGDPRWRASMIVCRRSLDRRIGVGGAGNGVADRFLSHRGWRRCLAMRDLFLDYVEAGLVNGQTLTTVTQHACSTLEWAVLFSNVDAFRCYLDAGADPAVVPTQGLKDSGSAFSFDFNTMASLDDLIQQVPASPQVMLEMQAALTQWRMDRHLDLPGPSPAPASLPECALSARELTAPVASAAPRPGRRL